MPKGKEKTPPELSWGNLKKIIVGCSTNFAFYRSLVSKSPGQAFKYLTFLVAVAAVVLGGREVYHLHREIGRLTGILKGNLPPIRIEKGRVCLEEKHFLLEKENPFPVRILEKRIQADKEFSPEIKAEALSWVEEKFGDSEKELDGSTVESELSVPSAGPSPDAAALIRRSADFGKFIFQVDVGGEIPGFEPGSEGVILTEETVYFRLAQAEPLSFSLKKVESVLINDDTLERWRKMLVLAGVPLVVLIRFVIYYICRLAQILLFGCLASLLTAAVVRSRFSFRQAFMVSLYALTPVVFLGLLVALLPVFIVYFWVVYLGIYIVYVAGATKNCCLLE